MPLLFRILGYGGNGVMLLLAVIGVTQHPGMGLTFGALAGLNLYLIHRLDRLSSEEAVLAAEIRTARLRQELAAIYRDSGSRDQKADPPLQLPRR